MNKNPFLIEDHVNSYVTAISRGLRLIPTIIFSLLKLVFFPALLIYELAALYTWKKLQSNDHIAEVIDWKEWKNNAFYWNCDWAIIIFRITSAFQIGIGIGMFVPTISTGKFAWLTEGSTSFVLLVVWICIFTVIPIILGLLSPIIVLRAGRNFQ